MTFMSTAAQRFVFEDGETLSWRQRNTFLEFYTEGTATALDQELDLCRARRSFGSARRSKSADTLSTTGTCSIEGTVSDESVKSIPDSPRSSSQESTELESTTLMLRNIACRFSQVEVAEILNEKGLKGTYDFVYLPRSPTRPVNLGYAFVNFISQMAAQRAWELLDSKPFGQGRSKSHKLCQVAVAHAQGQGDINAWKGRKSSKRSAPEPLWFDKTGALVGLAPTL